MLTKKTKIWLGIFCSFFLILGLTSFFLAKKGFLLKGVGTSSDLPGVYFSNASAISIPQIVAAPSTGNTVFAFQARDTDEITDFQYIFIELLQGDKTKLSNIKIKMEGDTTQLHGDFDTVSNIIRFGNLSTAFSGSSSAAFPSLSSEEKTFHVEVNFASGASGTYQFGLPENPLQTLSYPTTVSQYGSFAGPEITVTTPRINLALAPNIPENLPLTATDQRLFGFTITNVSSSTLTFTGLRVVRVDTVDEIPMLPNSVLSNIKLIREGDAAFSVNGTPFSTTAFDFDIDGTLNSAPTIAAGASANFYMTGNVASVAQGSLKFKFSAPANLTFNPSLSIYLSNNTEFTLTSGAFPGPTITLSSPVITVTPSPIICATPLTPPQAEKCAFAPGTELPVLGWNISTTAPDSIGPINVAISVNSALTENDIESASLYLNDTSIRDLTAVTQNTINISGAPIAVMIATFSGSNPLAATPTNNQFELKVRLKGTAEPNSLRFYLLSQASGTFDVRAESQEFVIPESVPSPETGNLAFSLGTGVTTAYTQPTSTLNNVPLFKFKAVNSTSAAVTITGLSFAHSLSAAQTPLLSNTNLTFSDGTTPPSISLGSLYSITLSTPWVIEPDNAATAEEVTLTANIGANFSGDFIFRLLNATITQAGTTKAGLPLTGPAIAFTPPVSAQGPVLVVRAEAITPTPTGTIEPNVETPVMNFSVESSATATLQSFTLHLTPGADTTLSRSYFTQLKLKEQNADLITLNGVQLTNFANAGDLTLDILDSALSSGASQKRTFALYATLAPNAPAAGSFKIQLDNVQTSPSSTIAVSNPLPLVSQKFTLPGAAPQQQPQQPSGPSPEVQALQTQITNLQSQLNTALQSGNNSQITQLTSTLQTLIAAQNTAIQNAAARQQPAPQTLATPDTTPVPQRRRLSLEPGAFDVIYDADEETPSISALSQIQPQPTYQPPQPPTQQFQPQFYGAAPQGFAGQGFAGAAGIPGVAGFAAAGGAAGMIAGLGAGAFQPTLVSTPRLRSAPERGQTGPGLLAYAAIMAAAQGLYYWRKRRK